MQKPQTKPAQTRSEEEPAGLSDADLAKVSGGGPHVRVFSGADGSLLLR